MPTTVFIDADGTVVDVHSGQLTEAELRAKLDRAVRGHGVTGGPLTVLAAIGPDRAWAYYLALGMVATVNPCGFAMLPAYLSYFLGLEDRDDRGAAGQRRPGDPGGAGGGGRLPGRVRGGGRRSSSSPRFRSTRTCPGSRSSSAWPCSCSAWPCWSASSRRVRLPRLDRGGRERTIGSMFVFGVSYAIASIGCTLPLFLARWPGRSAASRWWAASACSPSTHSA